MKRQTVARIVVIFFAVLMIGMTTTITALAATNASAQVSSKTEVSRGEEIAFTVEITNGTGVQGILIIPSYDSSTFELVSGAWTLSGGLMSDFSVSTGDGAIAFNPGISVNGTVLTFKLKAKADASFGAHTVSAEVVITDSTEVSTLSTRGTSVQIKCNHSYGGWTKVNDTTHKRTCSICQKDETANHSWNGGTVTKPASCKETGIKTYTCTTCNATETETIAKTTDHKYGSWTKVNDTTHKHTCSVCSKEETADHTWDGGSVTKSASCKETGIKTYACKTCKATKTATIAKSTKHTYSNNCDTTCNVCGGKRTAPHTYSNSCDTSCNSCKVKRTIKHTYSNNCDTKCNVCGKTRKITHAYKSVVTKATLTKNGKTVKQCSVCGKVSSTKTIKYAKTIKLSATSYTYDGKVKTPSVTVKDSGGKTLKKGTDYTVTYSSGRKNVGTYKVTIKLIGNYSGTKVLTFKIDPAKTSVSKLTAGKGSITATWKKTAQVTGYEVQYATSKSFSGAKTVTVAKGSTTKLTLKNLKSKKKYYVRVRTYKVVDGKKVYSAWSSSKNIKTK